MNTITICALALFLISYILMFAFQKLRPFIAIAAAIAFVIIGSCGVFPGFRYTWQDALKEIDWNVILMIAGTMGTVYLFIESKMPQLLSNLLISKVHSVKWMVVAMSLFAGVISAFVDNIATVLMVAPVALAACKKLNISPVPVIICISISSNLQGAATLVGDTTAILLGKAANLDFMDFFFVGGKLGMFWVTELGAVVSALIILWMFRREKGLIHISDRTTVEDMFPTWLLALTIISLILASFIPYESAAASGQFHKPNITNGLICAFYCVIGLIRQVAKDKSARVIKEVAKEIDYYTIALLIGIFVVIGGISKAGVIDLIGNTIAGLSGSGSILSVFIVYSIVVWMSVLLSAFIDNIPYTATMLPVVAVITQQLSSAGGIDINPNLLYFGLLVGATLGGNLTPIGASANIAGIGILRKEGYEVKSPTFMKYGVPFTLSAVASGYLALWFIWM